MKYELSKQQGHTKRYAVKVNIAVASIVCLLLNAPTSTQAQTIEGKRMTDMTQASTHDGSHDFDFWMGHWKSKSRKLVKFLVGSKQLETFEATCHASPLPAGVGNVDDFVPINWRPGFIGISLRLFNRDTSKWSIYWLNNKNAGMQGSTGHLATPVVGEFKDGVGIFTGCEVFDGVPIIVKYVWSNITANSARWHQEFSTDEGKTWEINWIMEHTRVEN